MSLSENLQHELTRQKLEQKELAERLSRLLKKKIGQSTISDWVTGKTHPRHLTLIALAKALKTTVTKLVA